METTYFADPSNVDIGKNLADKVEEFYRYLDSSGTFARMKKSYQAYFGYSTTGNGANSAQMTRGGKHNQLALMKVNHFRNLGQHILQLCVSQRPAPQPIATNSDYRSHAQVTLASGLLEYYSREKRVERNLRQAAEHAIVLSEGYVKTEWDSAGGERYGTDPESGRSMHEGDLRFTTLMPVDVIKDPNKEAHGDLDWVIVRSTRNRFDVAARWASKKEDILKAEPRMSDKMRLGFNSSAAAVAMESSDVSLFEFYHRKSDAVPDGLLVIFLADGTVLFKGPLPYSSVPIRRISPAELIGTPFGYTPMFDLLVLQEAIDALYSAVLTNQTSFGVQLIMAMKGSDIDFRQLGRGLAFIEYSSPQHKPEPLNLTHTPAEIFAFIKQLEAAMETISGINSTVRGNPEASLKSGSALALVQSQAIQFSQGLQHSYAQLVEDVFTDALNILRDYAKTKRTVSIVGKNNRHLLRSFTGADISMISRVMVDSGSALSQTAAGRIQIAQDLLANNLIKTPEEYLSVILTGKYEPMTEGQNAELMLIRSENEDLAEGKSIQASPIDSHSLHIREHRCVLANPDARNNPDVIRAVAEHINEHVEALAAPEMANLLIILGEQPLGMPMPTPEEAAGGTPPAVPGPQTGGVAALPEGGDVVQSSLPTNPATGQEWDPTTGGGIIPEVGQGA